MCVCVSVSVCVRESVCVCVTDCVYQLTAQSILSVTPMYCERLRFLISYFASGSQ